MEFSNRQQAGILLAQKLVLARVHVDIVLGLARGGVVVAYHAAKQLKAPFDVLVVKKVSSPYQAEFGIGAVAPDHVSYIDWKTAHRTGVDEDYINAKTSELNDEIRKKLLLYRKGKKPFHLKDKTVLLVDDGLATGATMEAAVKWVRKKNARRILVAIPVAPKEIIGKIKPEVSELMVLETPNDFSAVGQFYKEFPQVTDAEVVELLR